MMDFAKNKSFWENVRLSDDFAQHRDDVLALYKDAFKVEPRAHSYKDILENKINFSLFNELLNLLTS